ncbi:MAG: DNA topoisomerase IV subunit A [Lentisphaeria bacterium]|nr:DNA topoisomerase IV subunit A [Lentisphaeria bacterium]
MAKKKTNDKAPAGNKKKNQTPPVSENSIPQDPVDSEENDLSDESEMGSDEFDDEDLSDVAEKNSSANEQLRQMMNTNYLEYASYVIKDRAIPDVDDGLKPVQRRILWQMHREDDGSYHKVANIVGGTMKYHPHGDASIEGALVYLANKELFIDKQGNFGSIVTGDRAAAARYIEARLSHLGREVLFNDGITELVDSYDSRNLEPVRLPIKIPSLLLMGASGLAPGTRTDIMPHNFNELLNAQIAILKDEPFQVYPDFLQGGIMDASEYDEGNGKIILRARIDIDGRKLVIREIPALTDTQRLLESIDKAISKSKIKIASIHDLTAESVNIEIIPQRGYEPERAIQALYKYTDCQISVSLNMMVICENRPVRMSVSDILRRNTEKLLEYLRAELNIEIGKQLDKLLFRTLAQIFIEERIYKRIETCKTQEKIFSEVHKGLEKFRDEWFPLVQQLEESVRARSFELDNKEVQKRLEQLSNGVIPDQEIEKLLAIPIRRISLFDIEQNRKEMAEINALLAEAQKNLRQLKKYAISKLQDLLDRYGSNFPRRTEIRLEGFDKIDAAAIALNNIRVGWDKGGGYIGTSVKSEDVVVCNEFDHLLCIWRKGDYKIIDIPDKVVMDKLYEFRKYDKTTVFGIVYSDTKTGKVYGKRVVIDKFIKDKEYRLCPENCRLELITPRPNALYECRVDTPIKAKQIQQINLMELPMRSPRAGGTLLFPRKLMKITFVKYLDGTEDETDPALLEVSADPVNPAVNSEITETEDPVAENQEIKETEKQEKQSRKRKVKNPENDPLETTSQDSEEENWGISQPELGF